MAPRVLLAYLAVFAGVCGHASSEFFVKLSTLSGAEISVWRFMLGGAALALVALMRADSRDLLGPLRQDLLPIVGLSLAGMGLGQFLFHLALDYASAVQVATMVTVMPIVLVFVARVIDGTPVTAPKLVSGIGAFIGCLLLLTDGYLEQIHAGGDSLVGIALALGCATLGAIYLVLVKPYILRHGAVRMTTYTFTLGFVALWLVVGGVWGVWVVPTDLFDRSPVAIGSILALGIWRARPGAGQLPVLSETRHRGVAGLLHPRRSHHVDPDRRHHRHHRLRPWRSVLRRGARPDHPASRFGSATVSSDLSRGDRLRTGLTAGVLNGLVGIGGGIVIVPAMIRRNFTPQEAVGTSLATVVALSAIAFTVHAVITGISLGGTGFTTVVAAGMTGAVVGGRILARMSVKGMLLGFALVVFAVALRLIAQGIGWVSLEPLWPGEASLIGYAMVGGFSGLLSGMFGVGGGALVMLGLTVLFGLPVHAGLPVALAANVTNAIPGALSHSMAGRVRLGHVTALIPAALVGIAAGAAVAVWLPPAGLRIVFGGFFCLFSVRMVQQAMHR
jgi:uncharacterized membrane protein YfcA/drug/metabolite transporter (DMT)-like permease